MAITKAQQARQMYKKGSEKPVKQAGVMNYMPSEMVTVPRIAKSSPTTPTAKLAYITPEEENILVDLNLYGSLKGKPNRGPGGLPSLEGDFGGPGGFGGFEGGADFGGARDNQGNRGDVSDRRDTGTGNYERVKEKNVQKAREQRAKQINASREAEARRKAALEFEKRRKDKIAQEKAIKEKEEKKKRSKIGFDTTTKYGTPIIGPKSNISNFKEIETLKSLGAIEEDDDDDKATAKAIVEQNPLEKFLGNFKPPSVALIEGILDNIPGRSLREMYEDYGKTDKFKNRFPGIDTFKEYQQAVLDGKISAKGGLMGGFTPGGVQTSKDGTTTQLFQGGRDGPDNQIIPQIIPTTTAPTTTATTSEDESVDDIFGGELAARFGGSLYNFDDLRKKAMDGGIMNTDVIGGFADDSMDEMGRQMYGLGKLVKKVTRGVKKIVKSPIGKAALLYGLGAVGGSFGNTGKFFSKGMFNPGNIGRGLFGITAKGQAARGFPELAAKKGLLAELGLTGGYGALKPTALGGIGLASLTAGALTPKQKQELLQEEEEDDFNLLAIRNNPYAFTAPRVEGSQFAADGGRIGYQEGGDAEPVAKKTMPLIDMDGMEKDYRETGGFVEMGRMERADDVPARLSKNEFVFTADAVRNAGDGNIDKGAEVMYNMMKNLESGGEVSEESQGLEGARKMFQTSQRLGEVI